MCIYIHTYNMYVGIYLSTYIYVRLWSLCVCTLRRFDSIGWCSDHKAMFVDYVVIPLVVFCSMFCSRTQSGAMLPVPLFGFCPFNQVGVSAYVYVFTYISCRLARVGATAHSISRRWSVWGMVFSMVCIR